VLEEDAFLDGEVLDDALGANQDVPSSDGSGIDRGSFDAAMTPGSFADRVPRCVLA